MAPPPKSTDGRRKSGGTPTLLVTLSVPSAQLRELVDDEPAKEESPAPASETKETIEPKDSPDAKATPEASTPAATANGAGDAPSDSNVATPAAEGTPAPSVMGPPGDGPGPKKKGVKRSAASANGTVDGVPKVRGKPGPKKKPRLEDGTIDHAAVRANAAAQKLGPKANQGAINAGLRALDRSGKPCRKWAKGGFTMKTFTGVVWDIPRWTAPPKKTENESEETPADSADSSNKENKTNGQEENSAVNSNPGGDVEMRSAPSVNASSPAPAPVAAAS